MALGKRWVALRASSWFQESESRLFTIFFLSAEPDISRFRLFLQRAERIYHDLDLPQKIELSAFLIESAASRTVSFL